MSKNNKIKFMIKVLLVDKIEKRIKVSIKINSYYIETNKNKSTKMKQQK